MRSRAEPKKQFPIIFKQRIFSPDGGKTTIELRDYPVLLLDTADFSVTLPDWGLKLQYGEVADLPRQICRKFLLYWGKAERRALDDADADVWLKILDTVNFTEFSMQRAAPRVYEGELIRKTPFYFVEWSDGERARIPDAVGRSLALLEPGDMFTAEVKLGHEDEITSVENVVPLGEQSSVLAGALDGWPESV